jgi:hypothetical protein
MEYRFALRGKSHKILLESGPERLANFALMLYTEFLKGHERTGLGI